VILLLTYVMKLIPNNYKIKLCNVDKNHKQTIYSTIRYMPLDVIQIIKWNKSNLLLSFLCIIVINIFLIVKNK
jgi:hypothetical protein